MSYTIVTDSSCNLTSKMIEDYGLEIISLKYFAGEQAFESYTKGGDPDFKAFYNMARKKEPLSTTLASPELCETTFDRILAAGSDLIYIGFSSGLSGTYQVAHNVLEELKEKYPERKIYDVDSLAASLGQGLLVHYAVNKKNEGATIEELYDWLMEHRLNLCHWFTVDDLFYLKRGGRVSGAAAVMGTVLSIKPVMHVDDNGKLIPKAKVIGRKRAIEALVDKMKETAINPSEQTIFISHGDCIEDAEYLSSLVKETFGVKEVFIHYVEPVIGCHSGPGTLALFFMGTHR
ncbi:MAG: DegV family protein [Clostridia bacterium]|nr:DegV family protein [Clostridia bacterium]